MASFLVRRDPGRQAGDRAISTSASVSAGVRRATCRRTRVSVPALILLRVPPASELVGVLDDCCDEVVDVVGGEFGVAAGA